MDKKQLIGLVLIFGLFFLWSTLNTKSKKEIADEQRIQDSLAIANSPLNEETLDLTENVEASLDQPSSIENDTAVDAKLSYQYGPFAQNAIGTEKEYTLENDLIKVVFSNKGGFVKKVLLKNYNKLDRQEDNSELKVDLFLLEDEKNKFSFELPVVGVPNNLINTNELFFQGSQSGNTITFKAFAGENSYFEQIFTIKPGQYDLDYSLNFVNLDGTLPSGTESINLNWTNHLDKLERNYLFEKYYSTVYFKEVEKDSDYCNCRKDAEEDVTGKKLSWVSNSNQFFSSSLMAKNEPFIGGVMKTQMQEDDSENLKILTSKVQIPYASSVNYKYEMALFMGPNEFDLLKSYGNGLEEIIPYGRSIFGTINRWVIRPFFDFLDGFIGNKGISIIIMIFLVKFLLYPLSYKMLYSQAKMGALKPEIAKIKEKFADDAQGAQVENMKLYREYGVSPLGGCMPMILQMPIWYALFRFFPASIGFRQESFLWATDLSSFDVIAYLPFEIPAFGAHISLFTILWAFSTIAYTYYSTKHVDMSANPAMKYVQYFMPLMFLFFFNNYASGLTCYMFFSNLFNVAQTIGTKNFVFNEDKIRAELMKNKEKPKKTSKFQARLQDAMKQQQSAQGNKKKNKK